MISEINKIKSFDSITYLHCINVGNLAKDFSTYLNIYFNYNINIEMIQLCGDLHDIGKIKLDFNILNKKGHLTEKEFDHIKEHPQLGLRYLELLQMEIPLELKYSVLCHHKGIENTGYPYVNIEIPKEIQVYVDIITICDIFDALTSKRSYKNAFEKDNTFDIMDKSNIINPYLYKIFKSYINI